MERRRCLSVLLASAVAIGQVPVVWPGLAHGQAVRVGQAAPDISGGAWINSKPLTLEALRGRVVLVEFWTFG